VPARVRRRARAHALRPEPIPDGDGFWLPLAWNTIVPRWALACYGVRYGRDMILIGMFDSPFVRRAAISLDVLGFAFEHRDWSVGAQQAEIRTYNPLGRVPVLVLDGGETVIESSMILDYADNLVGDRALIPRGGEARRRALRSIALSIGAVEKALQIVGERVFRPQALWHAPYVERCTSQLRGALDELERSEWSDDLMQPAITLGCVLTYVHEAAGIDLAPWPGLAARRARLEALPVFAKYYRPFDAPVPT